MNENEKRWAKIKTEYIAGGVSMRELAEKHGVSDSTLQKRAAKEGWRELRHKTGEKTAEKLTETISDAKIKKIEELVVKLMKQTDRATRQITMRPVTTRERTIDSETATERVTVRTTYEKTKNVDVPGLRMLTATTKDLYEIVRLLKADTGETNAVTVRFEDGEDYSE